MAGTIEHLAIALELEKRWSGTLVKQPDLFFAGNVCPDGIQARKDYQRAMKMHTHFRDDIPDMDFGRPENLERFHSRISRFARRHLLPGSPWWDLYLGYVSHILADEIFMLTIRPAFMEKIRVLGLTERDAATFDHFTYDVNQIDFRLAREYPGMARVYQLLRDSRPYEIEEMVTQEELTRSREWILDFFFERAPKPEEPVYYTYEMARQYIQNGVEFIEERIWEYIGSE